MERRWSCAALPYPNLLGDNWMQQEIRRMGFDLAKGEGFYIEGLVPKCIPAHSSSSRPGAGKGRGSCLSHCIILHPSPKPAFPMKILIIWHGHADGKMLQPRLLQVAFFFSSSLAFSVLAILLLGGTGLVSLLLFILLLIQLSRAMVSLWQEAPHGRARVYNTSQCSKYLQNVHSH